MNKLELKKLRLEKKELKARMNHERVENLNKLKRLRENLLAKQALLENQNELRLKL